MHEGMRMTISLSMETRGDHLRVTVRGDIRHIDEIVDYSAAYRIEATRLGLRRVLIDYTDALFHLDYHDLHELAEHGVRKDFHLRGLRIAAVCSTENAVQHRQYETIAANRSITYKVFNDEASALDWLLKS